ILAKILAKLSGDVMLWECVTTGVFLLFLGVGTFRLARLRRTQRPDDLLRVEVALALLGVVSPLVIYMLHIPYRVYFYDFGILRDTMEVPPAYLFASFNLIFPALVGYVSGFELPLLITLAR